MSLNPMYVLAPSLEMYFVDRDSGAPLSGGQVFFYTDTAPANRIPKAVYEIQGDAANYTYKALPNPVILSANGTFQDNNGNNVLPYYYPYDADGNQELYYIEVYSSIGVPQFTRGAWPNPQAGITPQGDNSVINYIPNGQFLSHTDLPDNALVAGSNIIAQGGWSIELDSGATSTNTLTFLYQQPTQEPPQSPRYILNFICTVANAAEVNKSLRIKFPDVNKFNNQAAFTFAFWATATTNVPITIAVVKYFGSGTSSGLLAPIPVDSGTITPSNPANGLLNFGVGFGSNDGYVVGPNGDDWIAIDIEFPTDITFNVELSDFILAFGDTNIFSTFPIETNAMMLSNSLAGWVPTPNPNGFDLYCSPVLTREGMAWDHSQIGRVQASLWEVPLPSSSDAISNDMPLDGTSYVSSDYSYLGIPYARISQLLIDNSPLANTPMFGTGSNFATAYTTAGNTSLLRLTYNTAGTGSTAAVDGNTGWTIGSIVTYGASVTGSVNIGYTAYSNVANTVLAVGSFVSPNAAATANTSGFTVTTTSYATGLLAQQTYAITVLTVAASSLANPSGTAKYFKFSNSTTNFYMWFQITNESDPAPGGTGIKIVLDAGATAQDVANIVREAINAYQISTINISSVPAPSLSSSVYWVFTTNPASSVNYYVWYKLNGVGQEPTVSNSTGILVDLVTGDTTATTMTKTLAAINAYQFAAGYPGFQGMFLRGLDASGVWDADVTQRWSSISGLSGANYGTFEFEQFLSHVHAASSSGSLTLFASSSSGGALKALTPNNTSLFKTDALSQVSQSDFGSISATTSIANTGGNETRPVNAVVQWLIKY